MGKLARLVLFLLCQRAAFSLTQIKIGLVFEDSLDLQAVRHKFQGMMKGLLENSTLFRQRGGAISIEISAITLATEPQTTAAYYLTSPTANRNQSAWNHSVCWVEPSCPGGVGPACLCIPGYFRAYGQECLPCPAGTYKSIYGFDACTPCPEGFVSVEGSAERCSPCDGLASSDGTRCTPCAGIPHALTLFQCRVSACVPGFVPSADRKLCVACPPDWYQPDATAEVCLPPRQDPVCDGGSLLSADGSVCVPCPRNWFRSGASCVPCASYQYTSGEGATECLVRQCPNGSLPSADGQACDPCPLDSIQVDDTCVPCNPDQFTLAEGATECLVLQCPSGSLPSADGRACVPCPPNSYQVGAACVP